MALSTLKDNGGMRTGNTFASNSSCANLVDFPNGMKRLVCCYTLRGVFLQDVQATQCTKTSKSQCLLQIAIWLGLALRDQFTARCCRFASNFFRRCFFFFRIWRSSRSDGDMYFRTIRREFRLTPLLRAPPLTISIAE